MAEPESFTNPFRTQRELHPVKFSNLLSYLESLPYIIPRDRLALQVFITYSTNPILFDRLRSLNINQMKELAMLTIIGLKNLRNMGGRPASTVATPITTPVSSPAASPSGSPQSNKSLRESFLAEQAGKSSPILPPPKTLGIADTILDLFEITNPHPNLPRKGLGRASAFKEGCKIRQENRCAITSSSRSTTQSAHIFPFSALDYTKRHNAITWRFLVLFLGEKKRDELVNELQSDKSGIHTTANGISVASDIHSVYDQGYITIVPLHRPIGDRRYMDVYIHALNTQATLRGLATYHRVAPDQQYLVNEDTGVVLMGAELPQGRNITHATQIRLGTVDPDLYPLPSPLLLFWHRHLWQSLTAIGLGIDFDDAHEPVDPHEPPTKKPKISRTLKFVQKSPLSKQLGGVDGTYEYGDYELDVDDWEESYTAKWVADNDIPYAPLEEL
ncbi:hypothetical protein TWF696_003141 [Orbilia brochopaga]|uniref:HNH nuclease domain-containing protein n=1 Tax=Orbilia brochopaga TaxID=3140254 RepID=A0AAV9U0Z6_9PEZI